MGRILLRCLTWAQIFICSCLELRSWTDFAANKKQPIRRFLAASPPFRKKEKATSSKLTAFSHSGLLFSVLCCQLPSLGLDQIRHRRLANPTDLPCAAASALLCAPVFFQSPSSAYTSPVYPQYQLSPPEEYFALVFLPLSIILRVAMTKK